MTIERRLIEVQITTTRDLTEEELQLLREVTEKTLKQEGLDLEVVSIIIKRRPEHV